jgi:ribonucleoside-diphosphate reductase alpha chain
MYGEDADISNFVTSKDIDWKDRVEVQSALQNSCDTAISSTCNLPKGTTLDEIKQIYLRAWKSGCKGFTVYVDGSRNPILSTSGFENQKSGQVAKRPKELVADYYQVRVKGETFAVLVGLLNDNPYEVFAFRVDKNTSHPNHKGKIIKVKKNHYKFVSNLIEIPDLRLTNDNIEEQAATLYTSMLLRHNANLKYIIKTAKKVNDNITSFSSAMCRVLSKYMPTESLEETCPECSGKLIREHGCIHCESCGWSRCE